MDKVKLLITEENEYEEMEIYEMWYKCPHCGCNRILIDFNYCPGCGNELEFVFQGAENT